MEPVNARPIKTSVILISFEYNYNRIYIEISISHGYVEIFEIAKKQP